LKETRGTPKDKGGRRRTSENPMERGAGRKGQALGLEKRFNRVFKREGTVLKD